MKLNKLKILLLFLLALVSVSDTSAQQLQATLSHYSTDDGMSSNTVSDIKQDDYGYIWISTWNGLSRFDGYDFFNYQTGAASRIPKLHNRIQKIAIDHQQNVWMLMYDARIFVLKRSVDKIINPFEKIGENEDFRFSLPFYVTSTGDVLVYSPGYGVFKLRFEGDEVKADLFTTGDLVVTSIAEGYQNDIWLGTNKGVRRMDMSNMTVEGKGYFLDEEVSFLYSNGYNIFAGTQSGKILSFSYGQEPVEIRSGGLPITGLFVDSYGVIWFSDSQPGVLRLKNDEKRFVQHVAKPDYDVTGSEFDEVFGTVWMRMNKGGYGYYNRATDEVEYFHNDPSNPWNLSNTITTHLELNEGVIWQSTNKRGLEKLEIQKHTIERKRLFPEEGSTPSNDVRAMHYDSGRRELLIGNKAGSLFVIKENGQWTEISSRETGNPFGRIYGLLQDKKDNYWVSCKGSGLYQVKPIATGGYQVTSYHHEEGNEWSLNDDNCYQSVEDPDGNIWVATYGGGVNLLTRDKSGKQIFIHNQNLMKNYPKNSYQKVRTIAVDRDGVVWAGTTDGILLMSYKDRNISIRELLPSEEFPDKILLSNDVVCLTNDRQGDIWVGTSGGGLARAVEKDSEGRWLFESYGMQDGLPIEEVISITFDNNNNVWFSTDHVIYSLDTQKRIFTTFSNLEGIDETTCSESASLSLPNGHILFGTVNGYYVIDRTKLVNTSGSVLKLRITDFWINDELQTPRKDSPIDYYVPGSKSVELPNHGDLFSFRFASLNYHLQHRVHYQYMLEGYDDSWQNANRQRIASYNNVPTGTYHFKVKAFLLESPDKYDIKQIEVIVPPYFLLSSNAIWVYMILGASLGIWLMFRRQKYLDKSEKLRIIREGPRRREQQIINDDFIIFLNEFLDIHFSDPMLSVEEMVAASEQKEEEFTHTLYRLTGKGPNEYLLNYRLKRAVEMLETTNMSIAEISYHCGFVDTAVFSRQFLKKTGFMPSKYRDLCKKVRPNTE